MAYIQFATNPSIPILPAQIVSAESVIGCEVVDRKGVRVGQLRDIILDLATGRMAYAVIALSARAQAEPLIVVPWNAVHPDRDQQLRVNAHADWIHRAPSVQAGLTPHHFVHEWGAFIHNYFGTRPYWEAAVSPQYS